MTRAPAFSLEQLQRWLQAVITHPLGVEAGLGDELARAAIDVTPPEVEQVVPRSATQSAIERLNVYAGAYFARLHECLADEFPAVAQLVGDEAFQAFALDYLVRHPSRSYTLNVLGRAFPDYLETSCREEDAGEWGEMVVDLARLEWTFSEVFDGPGMENEPPLSADSLAQLPPERWSDVRLLPAPCLRLLELRCAVNGIYKPLRAKQAFDLPERVPTYVAVTRRNYVVERHELPAEAFTLLRHLTTGELLGEAIVAAASASNLEFEALGERLPHWFRDWARWGFFQRIECPRDRLGNPPGITP